MFRNTYLTSRFFYAISFCIFLFVLAYSYESLFLLAKIVLVLFGAVVLYDWSILFRSRHNINCTRSVLEKLSLGDDQAIHYKLINNSNLSVKCTLYDELPEQLQHRTFIFQDHLPKGKSIEKDHLIRPEERGEYKFGRLLLYVLNPKMGFVQKRLVFEHHFDSEVHPSIIQMRKYELQVFSKNAILSGVRQIRKIGENDEFEYIRPYMQGDNIKSINWKATSRKNELVVNQYQNTRSQMVYSIIDMGRSMKMPFYGLTLLDHAINSALVISNIILKKYDKAGLITFSDKIQTIVRAKSITGQLENISLQLYNQKTQFKESNFELLYHTTRRQISRRSILLFYTNFENEVDLDRYLPYLQRLSQRHLLVVILFINTEILKTAEMKCETKSDIYRKTFAEKAISDKERIAYRLNINKIQTILTTPEDLSINVINRYLEIKNKRMV